MRSFAPAATLTGARVPGRAEAYGLAVLHEFGVPELRSAREDQLGLVALGLEEPLDFNGGHAAGWLR